MNAQTGRYYVVANRAGRIVALLPASAISRSAGGEVGWRPVARPGQRVAEVNLTEEHSALLPHELIEHFVIQIDRKTSLARLARRAVRRSTTRKR